METLGRIRRQPAFVVPQLIRHLQSTNRVLYGRTMLALSDFGERAQAATPSILPFLNDADELIRYEATNALKRIDPRAATEVGIE
jgi:HEAT repeat protein